MKIFIDTADIDEIKESFASELVDGITTNPSLMKKAIDSTDIDIEEYILQILEIAKGNPVSLEIKGGTSDEMYSQAINLYKKFSSGTSNIVIKIPINESTDNKENVSFEALKTINKLSVEGIPVNVTLIFTPEQALLAAKAGATYVSPFIGRIDDKIRHDNDISFKKQDYYPSEGYKKGGKLLEATGFVSGIDLLRQVKIVLDNYDMQPEIIAASVRNTRQARECMLVGSDIATLPFHVFKELTTHPKTLEGMKKFSDDTVKEYENLM